MNQKIDFDVVGIGNAIVDVLAKTDDAFLEKHNLDKGSMRLIDAEEAEALYADMGPAIEVSGGSAANTIAGIAALGGRAAYIGTVAVDQLGDVFRHDLTATGVQFGNPAKSDVGPTARSFVLVTPDAQRTMCTFLGASQALGPEDIDEDLISRSAITYLEGYLWDPPHAKQAFLKAAELAHKHNRKVALTLSDAFCVERYREEFLSLLKNDVDIVFANEDEVKSLFQIDDFDAAIDLLDSIVEVAAITRSEKGAIILANGERRRIEAVATEVVDTTGAGDLFAAGFLFGISQGRTMELSGNLGAIAAAEIISHLGARPESDLKKMIRDLL